MKFRTASHAVWLSAAAVLSFAAPSLALPIAPSALSASVDRIDLRSETAARRAVRRNTVNVTRKRDVNIRRNTNVNINRRVVVRPVRPWVRRPWFGTVVAGVTIGTIVAATSVPAPPAPNLCWFWADSSNTRGYWDYCTPPR